MTINVDTGTRTVEIPAESITCDEGAWPRRELDEERTAEFLGLYAEREPDALPPIEVVAVEDGRFLLADGWHRLIAQLRLGELDVRAIVLQPPAGRSVADFAYERALETAARAPKPLCRAEKRSAIARLLSERPGASDRELARLVGVDHKTVGSIRSRLGNSPEESGLEDEPPGERYLALLAADDLARQLVRSTDRLWQERSLGEMLLGDRIGQRLAVALQKHHGAGAYDWGLRLQEWSRAALAELKDEKGAR